MRIGKDRRASVHLSNQLADGPVTLPELVVVPMKQVVKVKSKDGSWAVRQSLNFESVTFNDVDPVVFTPPQAVRDLVANGTPAATP
jgi:hypothetical protein